MRYRRTRCRSFTAFCSLASDKPHPLPLSKHGKCFCRPSPPSSQLPHAGRALALLQLWRSDITDDDDDSGAVQEPFQVCRRIPCRLLGAFVLTSMLSSVQLSSSHLHALLHFLLLAPQNRCLLDCDGVGQCDVVKCMHGPLV